jgi:tetratricopeptide (TPR) repeat protein
MEQVDPFLALRSAFDQGQNGRWTDAGYLFKEALSAFDRILRNPETPNRLSVIAAQNPATASRCDEVSGEFLKQLPGWLREMHYDHFKEEFNGKRLSAAIAHWKALVFAAGLASFSGAIDLRNLREEVCQHFQLTPENLAKSEDTTADCTQRAERLLKADPDNTAIRYSSIEGYARLLKIGLDRIMPRNHDDLPGLRVTATQKRCAELSLRRTAPRLKAHLSRVARVQDMNSPVALFGYRQLGRYYSTTGDYPMAIRMARRARRLDPNDQDLIRWVRSLRRMGRSK